MSNKIVITVTDSLPAGIDKEKWTSDNNSLGLNNIANTISAIVSGSRPGSVSVLLNNGNAVQASGIVTLGTSGSSTKTQVGDICLINGVAFTCVSSGATGNQFNQGANDGAAAANLVTAISGSSSGAVSGIVTAAAVANVVTVTAVEYGLPGNSLDLEARGSGALVVTGAGAQASGTLTLSSSVATDTVVVNGITFTCVASGATGNQWNVGGTDTISATNLAAAINASVSAGITNYIFATSSAAVVTIQADRSGTFGNEMTITGGAHITASGARLTGGTDSAVVNFSGGTADTSAKTYTGS